MIENANSINVDKKNWPKKTFIVFNGRPPNTIEHTPTLFGQRFYYFLLTYMKNVFSTISRFVYQHFVGLVNIGDLLW